MNVKQCILAMSIMIASASTATAASLAGTTWMTIDDKTGKPRAEVRLSEQNGEVSGDIVSVIKQPGDTGICSKCPGHFKNKPIQGIQFVWGLKQKGENNWDGGQILDPKTGKIYRAKMLLKGNKLYVRGYIGLSVLGRTQVWEKQR